MSALVPGDFFRFDNTKHISLDELAQGLRSYDSMPTLIQEALKNSIWLTLATNIVSIPLMWFAPMFLPSFYPVEHGFFYFTGDWVNSIFALGEWLSVYLIVLNGVCLALILTVIVASWAMTKSVREGFHWLAWSAAIPTGLSAVSTALIVGLVLILCVVAAIIWLVIGVFILCVAVGLIAILLED
jgi:hypothetical protein